MENSALATGTEVTITTDDPEYPTITGHILDSDPDGPEGEREYFITTTGGETDWFSASSVTGR